MGYRRLRLPIIVIAVATFVVGFAPAMDDFFQPKIQFAIKDAMQVLAMLTMAIAAIWVVERGIEQSAIERKRDSQRRSYEELRRWAKESLALVTFFETYAGHTDKLDEKRHRFSDLIGQQDVLIFEMGAFGDEWQKKTRAAVD